MKFKHKHIILVLVIILLLFVLDSFKFPKLKGYFYGKEDNSPEKVLLLTTSVKLRYLFLLPITIKFWQLIGVQKVIVVLINDKNVVKEDLSATIEILKEFNVDIKIFNSHKLSPTSLSQIIRLFGPVLPSFGGMLKNETILITSDADLAVFNLSNHIPDVKNGKELHLYNSDCCEPIKVPPMRGNHKVKQYTMITIAATVKTWKEIMGFNKKILSIEEIENYIINEFGPTFFHSSDEIKPKLIGSDIWYADQSLISYKIDQWLKKNYSKEKMSTHSAIPRRIDRATWLTPEQFSNLNISNYDDCHQPTAAFAPGEWEKYLPFLELALKKHPELIERFQRYRKKFISRNTFSKTLK